MLEYKTEIKKSEGLMWSQKNPFLNADKVIQGRITVKDFKILFGCILDQLHRREVLMLGELLFSQ